MKDEREKGREGEGRKEKEEIVKILAKLQNASSYAINSILKIVNSLTKNTANTHLQ